MKTMNKVIAAMMMMAITTMPAMAGNKHHNDKKTTVVIVTNDKKASHFDKVDKKTAHFDAHKHAYRPEVKTCTFRVSHHDSHRKVVAKVEHMKGVMDTKWNPRTREVTVICQIITVYSSHHHEMIALRHHFCFIV